MAAKDLEGRDWVVGLLNHVVKFWRTVLEPGWWMTVGCLAKPSVELSCLDALFALL